MSTLYGPGYRIARAGALERSHHTCQFCGSRPATDGHHWAAGAYPPDKDVAPGDITALCSPCHQFATTIRRFMRAGGDAWQLLARLAEGLEQCDMQSKSRVSARSSCTTERPDSTPDPLPISKRQISRRSAGATAPQRTTPDSRSLNAKPLLWLDASGAATIPAGAIRACIETGARKLKQGPQVREGLIVDSIDEFIYDRTRYGASVEELRHVGTVHGRRGGSAQSHPQNSGQVRRLGIEIHSRGR